MRLQLRSTIDIRGYGSRVKPGTTAEFVVQFNFALDEIARHYANGTLRITTRQTIQLHGVIKSNLKEAMQRIDRALLTTIAACGDVNRNVLCTSNPHQSSVHEEAHRWAVRIDQHLTDIMMAQDFHDLTGQVIRRVVALATSLEEQLVKLLIETSRPEPRPQLDPYKLEGPVVAPNARDDVVADQKGVDDLLASLGF